VLIGKINGTVRDTRRVRMAAVGPKEGNKDGGSRAQSGMPESSPSLPPFSRELESTTPTSSCSRVASTSESPQICDSHYDRSGTENCGTFFRSSISPLCLRHFSSIAHFLLPASFSLHPLYSCTSLFTPLHRNLQTGPQVYHTNTWFYPSTCSWWKTLIHYSY